MLWKKKRERSGERSTEKVEGVWFGVGNLCAISLRQNREDKFLSNGLKEVRELAVQIKFWEG